MTKYKLEYIWLDGKKPIPELRGKTQLKSFEKPPTVAELPLWGFDGSSTMQAEGSKSDCILKPVALYPDASRKDAYIVLSEVMHPDGNPHSTNYRATIEDDADLWVGLEQEYFVTGVRRKPVGDDCAGRTRSNNDVVIDLHIS